MMMRFVTPDRAGRADAGAVPSGPDCETAALLRQFLTPIFEAARSWRDLAERLDRRGYGVTFRLGRMLVFDRETGTALCTGTSMGVPLRELAARLGRPVLRLNHDGCSAELDR
ncbi:hypothetical protein [Salipiger mucosus]|uniref:Uncharacterized protein n=1 Tax=Salipiger mucosus DSM 16094 TaxID=1123237 RepID=S9QJK8_9RHOB|nr:hypothetical protein [Salipiger mucosus]EPX79783.1 hypothetical protein Salmuc_05141 [Salipiger mucosus DSM 16094]